MSCSCPFFTVMWWISPSNIASPPPKKRWTKVGDPVGFQCNSHTPAKFNSSPPAKIDAYGKRAFYFESWKPFRLFRGKLLLVKASEVYTLPMSFFWSNTTSLRSSGNKHHPGKPMWEVKLVTNREAEQKKRSHIWGGFTVNNFAIFWHRTNQRGGFWVTGLSTPKTE